MTARHPRLIGSLTLAIAGAALLLGGCGERAADPFAVAVIGTGPLALGEATEPSRSAAQSVLRATIAQGLVRFDSRGQIEPGLAERWNVSDDGLSYIFRLAAGEWTDGRKITARDVARILKRQMRAKEDSSTREALGAVQDIVAMTDRVIEIRLAAPRPHLLELLAQPDFALIREGVGSGPFQPQARPGGERDGGSGTMHLARFRVATEREEAEREEIHLEAMPARAAIAAFRQERVDLVLGGTVADLPYATRAELPRGALRFDPASGLFGLAFARKEGPLAEPELRRLLSEAIDRDALIAALGVPGLLPRATVLQGELEGVASPVQPAWLGQPIAERRPELIGEAQRLLADAEPLSVRIALPEGPGGDLLFARLAADWGAIGLGVKRAQPSEAADLVWVDEVSPSTSPAWFLRHFRCGRSPICLDDVDTLLDSARIAPDALQRSALLGQAAAMIDEAALFIPIAAPVRWSLVGDRATGYQDNRFNRHSLADIMQRPTRGF